MKRFLMLVLIANIFSASHNPPTAAMKMATNNFCIKKYWGAIFLDSSQEISRKLITLFKKSSTKNGGCPPVLFLQYYSSGYSTYREWYFFIEGADSNTYYFKQTDFYSYTDIIKLRLPFSLVFKELASYSKKGLSNQEDSSQYTDDGYTLIYHHGDTRTFTWFYPTDQQVTGIKNFLKKYKE